MKLDFAHMEETSIPQFKGGTGTTYARMYSDSRNRIMRSHLAPGASIGLHTHAGSSEVIYVLSGTGTAVCDGAAERLGPGDCHYCPEGHAHTLINDGGADLVFFAVVPQHN